MNSLSQNFFNSPSRLYSLQLAHQQLEQSLAQAQQILDLQLKLLQKHQEEEGREPLLAVTESLIEEQASVRWVFTEQLLKRQVQVEREKEMKEMIGNYEKRIFDLRAMLISKEAEIHCLGWEPARDVLRRDNLKILNTHSAQRHILAKIIQQRKKLRVEVEALGHTLTTSYPQTPKILTCKSPSKAYSKRISSHTPDDFIFGKQNFLQRDGLAQRATKILVIESQKENILNQQFLKLKNSLADVEEERKKLKLKYFQLVMNKKKGNEESKTNMLCVQLSTVPESNFECSQSKEDSNLGHPQLLANIELNQAEILSPGVKTKKRPMTLKEKNCRKLKQN